MEVRPLSHDAILDICTWIYEGEYACYSEDSYESKVRRQADILNPEKKNQYLCFYDGDVLAAYAHLKKKDDALMLGISVRPELCGQGYGTEAIKLLKAMILKQYSQMPLRLIVRSWNQRAIRCYQKAGFVVTGEKKLITPAGPGHFILMEMRTSA